MNVSKFRDGRVHFINSGVKVKVGALFYLVWLHSTVGSASDCRSRGPKFESQLGHIAFAEIDYEIQHVTLIP